MVVSGEDPGDRALLATSPSTPRACWPNPSGQPTAECCAHQEGPVLVLALSRLDIGHGSHHQIGGLPATLVTVAHHFPVNVGH